MLDLLTNLDVGAALKTFFGDAYSNEFVRMMTVFSLAAFVHGRQVRTEIRTQLTLLTSVLKTDLAAQKEIARLTSARVTTIEQHLNLEGKNVRNQ